MPMDYDREKHGPVHWPMPWPGVWLRDDERPDREHYWRLQDAALTATSYARTSPAEPFETFRTDRGRECVWLDCADPAGCQRLFVLDGGGIMSRTNIVRRYPFLPVSEAA